jgi:hypothetical protein
VVKAIRTPRRAGRRKNQGGYALLLVFLMAAVFAITLYMEIPRVAVESERAKEQLLIERGEQYKRAIQLFYNKAKRYPTEIKELESFQNQRFLRHRYIDPMTGKDEWRIIHVSNGVLTDSKVQKPQKQGEEKKDNGTFAGVENSFGTGATGNQQGGAAIAQNRRRSNDGGTAGSGPELPVPQPGATGTQQPQLIPGQQNLAGQNQPGMPNQVQPIPGMAIPGQQMPVSQAQGGNVVPGQIVPGQIGQPQGIPGQITPGGIQPGQFPGGGRQVFPVQQQGTNASNTNSSGGASSFGAVSNSFGGGTTTPTAMPLQPGQTAYNGPPLPQQPGPPVNSQTGNVSPYPTNPAMIGGSQPGIGQPGMQATPPTNAASDMINRILTSPRPGGMPQQGQVGGGLPTGNGMAGVASNAEGEGIMVYNDRTLYGEWEFIYDPQKQKRIPNPNATGAGGTPAQQMGTPAGAPGVGNPGNPNPPSPGFGSPTSSGSQSGFSGGNSFGTSNSFGGGNSFGSATPSTGTPTGGRGVQPPPTPQLPGR